MAKSIWNADERAAVLARFDALRPDAKPEWGVMSVSQMVKHCTLPFLAAAGEMTVTPKKTPFRNWVMKKLIIYVLPWPKGAPTAIEFLNLDEGDLKERVAELKRVADRFAANGPGQKFAEHAAFGELTGGDWGALMHRHLEHHLRQFSA